MNPRRMGRHRVQERSFVLHRGSDVDIGLLAKQAITVDSIIDIRNAIESSIVPYHVDVVDFLTADSNFKRVALEKIVIWNKPADISIG